MLWERRRDARSWSLALEDGERGEGGMFQAEEGACREVAKSQVL